MDRLCADVGLTMASKHSDRQPLTARQQLFVQEYLLDLNAAQAAIRAGYSTKSVREIGSRLLTKVNIQAALTEAMAARAQRVEVRADTVLREIALLAYSDVTNYPIDDEGNVHLRPGAPEGAMRAVQSIRKKIYHTAQGVTYDVEVRTHSKAPVLRMAAEHLGLLLPQASPQATVNILVQYAVPPPER